MVKSTLVLTWAHVKKAVARKVLVHVAAGPPDAGQKDC